MNGENVSQFTVGRRRALGAMGVMAFGFLPNKSVASINARKGKGEILTFHSLIDAKESDDLKDGDVVHTLGYHKLGDGGAATYEIAENRDKSIPNEGDVVKFNGNLLGLLIDVDSVNYKIFGALGNGDHDDGAQIKIAHAYANRHKLPVVNFSGEYWIEQTREIEIKTSVHWGQTIFHIKEAFNTKAAVFRVLSYDAPLKISVSDPIKKKILERLKPGTQIIPELKEYKNSLILVKDENDRIGFRAGEKYVGQSRAKEELFYVEEEGKILGDFAWNFSDYTDLTAYPAETSYLTIEGGTFYLSGDNPGTTRIGYFQNGFSITRSRTIIKNQWMGLEKGRTDIAFNPRNGFYNFNCVYDTSLENIRLIPWEQDRPGTDQDVFAGTYGIGGNRMLNTTFKNVTAEGTLLHWGVFGTNMNKNFRIENCSLNRIDVHFHCWNLTIKDSKIGNRGISITGGGDLIIENTSCENPQFVNFRRDFGAKWDGSISIRNCKLKPITATDNSILYFIAGDFDYRYPIGLARNISVENFVVDYSSVPESKGTCWLMRTSNFSITSKGERLFFPKNTVFRNVRVEGRDKGVRMFQLPNPHSFLVSKHGAYDGSFIDTNALIQLQSIQLESILENEDHPFHLNMDVSDRTGVYDEQSLYPRIEVSNCNNFSGNFGGVIAEILIESSIVNQLYVGKKLGKARMPGELTLLNCKFLPYIYSQDTKPYQLDTELGTSFTNCVFLAPKYKKETNFTMLPLVDFMVVNSTLLFNHLNSRLGNDILQYYKSKGIKINLKFIEMLKSRHDLERLS